MQTVIFLAAGVAAAAAVVTLGLGSRLHIWFKTAATLIIALLVALAIPKSPLPGFTPLLAAGLVLAALGDFLLARRHRIEQRRPNDAQAIQKLFISALSAFLLCHLAYLAAVLFEFAAFRWWLFGVVLVPGLVLYLALRRGMKGLRLPVALYVLAISAMVAAMLSLWWEGDASLSLLLPLTVGAGAFWLSDALLAVDVFAREKLPRHEGPLPDVIVLVLYYLAQLSFGFVVFAF